MKKIKILQIFFIVFISLLFILIIITPHLIQKSFLVSKNFVIDEEYIESFIIIILLIISCAIFIFYKKELIRRTKKVKKLIQDKNSLETQLNDAFKYIGSVNVQIDEIRKIFSSINKYPENKKDFKTILKFLAERTLGIVNSDWVILRVVDLMDQKTLSECIQSRGESVLLKHEISNKALIDNEKINNYSIVNSDQKNLNIRIFCILPIKKITPEQKNLIKVVVNQVDMLFIIFTSNYYKERI